MKVETSPVPFNLIDYLLMGLSVLIAIIGIFALPIIVSKAVATPTGENVGAIALAWGLLVAGAGSGLGVFLRKRTKPSGWKLIAVAVLWWLGVFTFSFGGFAILNPAEKTWFENFGYATAICFVPGGLLILAGVMLFRFLQRKSAADAASVAEKPVPETNTVPTRLSRAEKLARAEEYRRHIAELLHNPDIAPFVPDIPGLNSRLSDWQAHIGELVQRLEEMDNNPLIRRDLQEVPKAIADLKRRLLDETDPDVYTQLEETLADYRRQQDNLDLLMAQKRRIELELDESLATVGTIYSQMQMLGSQKAVDGRRAERLMESVEQETARLNDVLQAMNETYSGASGS